MAAAFFEARRNVSIPLPCTARPQDTVVRGLANRDTLRVRADKVVPGRRRRRDQIGDSRANWRAGCSTLFRCTTWSIGASICIVVFRHEGRGRDRHIGITLTPSHGRRPSTRADHARVPGSILCSSLQLLEAPPPGPPPRPPREPEESLSSWPRTAASPGWSKKNRPFSAKALIRRFEGAGAGRAGRTRSRARLAQFYF